MMERNGNYRMLVDSLPDALSYCQIVWDPVERMRDYIFLDVNAAFEEMLRVNKEAIIGRKVTEVLADLRSSKDDWFSFLERAAVTGMNSRFEMYWEPLDRWYEVNLFNDKEGYYAHMIRCAPPGTGEAYGYILTMIRNVTSRKQAEEALKKSAEEQAMLLDNTDVHIWYLKDPQTYGRVNKTLADFWGVTPESIEDKGPYDLMHREEVEVCVAGNRHVFEKKEKLRTEQWVTNGKGTTRLFAITKAPKLDLENNVEYVICSAEDITERKMMEEALRESEKRYRGLLESQNDLIVRVDTENRLTFVNDTYCQTFGKSRKELLGKSFTPFIHEEDLEGTLRAMEGLNKPPYRAQMEQRALTVHGWRWIHWEDSALLNEEGEIVEIQGVGRDITELKEAEKKIADEAVKRAEEKYRQILDSLEEAYLELDLWGKIVFCNRYAAFLFGYTTEDMLGMDCRKLAKNPQAYGDLLQKIDRSGRPERLSALEMVHKEGRVIYADLLLSLISDETGVFKGFRVSGRDITERKQAEEKIRYMSFHDTLTGLYNRAYFEETVQRLDTERQLPISVIMADLNGLKLVNDTYGHNTGDVMLKRGAEALKGACRQEDVIARWGGDEFVILLPKTEKKEAEEICRRIKEKCRGACVEDIPISMALGAASKESKDRELLELLNVAEDEMYRQKLAESRSTRSAVLKALLKTLEAKSFETEAHVRFMQDIAAKIGEKAGLSEPELNRLNLLMTLHDIGKINISEELLTKKEPLTEEEWEIMKKHPETGYRIARATEEFAHVAEDILAHHERWDGLGYPRGLKKKEIPLLARITAVVDAYEVMYNGRPYKEALPLDQVVQELKKCAGTHFDPEIVDVLLAVLTEELKREMARK